MSVTEPERNRTFPFQLDLRSGVPVYRQIIDQVMGGKASGLLLPGDQLPTVRQVAVDLSINPNTVVRAYRELEIRGVLETQQGTGPSSASRRWSATRWSGSAGSARSSASSWRGRARKGSRFEN